MIGLSAAVYCCFQLFCVLLILLYQGKHLSLSVRRKITFNVFYSTFTYVFLFLSRFYVFIVFYFGERFFIYVPNGISICSAVFAQITAEYHQALQYYVPPLSLLKLPFRVGDLDPI